MQPLFVRPIKTLIYRSGENLHSFILKSLQRQGFKEDMILAITSKIVSLAENRVLDKKEISKLELVKRESDHYLGEGGYGCHLTIKHGLLIPSAGIDESNSEDGVYILYPERPFESAQRIYEALSKALGLQSFGVLLTDSHTTPLRRGVTGISLAHWGFQAIKNFVGQKDLFGRPLQMTTVNAADALATTAVYTMGEAAESCPLAIVENPGVQFGINQNARAEAAMPLEEDLYYPLLK